MKKVTFLLFFFYSIFIQAQDKLYTSKGEIDFEASVPLFEEIKAINHDVYCLVELKSSEINCTVVIEKFKFKRDLMKAHFNDNYLESHRYPKATFNGIIEKFDYKSLTDKPTEYLLKGNIKIHGKSKPISIKAFIKKVNQGMEISSSFYLNTQDFNIEIPSIVASKISNQVYVSLKAITNQN